MNNKLDNLTQNYFYKKQVIVYQHKQGYRFSIDAPVLADFLPFAPGEKALEIGVGSGIIGLLALYRNKFSFIYGFEIQEQLSRLARFNAEQNGFSDRFKIFSADFKEAMSLDNINLNKSFLGGPGGQFFKNAPLVAEGINEIKHIFSNPPFFKTGRGRLSPNREIRHAKFETKLNLETLLTGSYSLLAPQGSLYLIFPYARFVELERLARETGFFIFKKRLIFSFKDGRAERFLVQLTNYEVSQVTLEPLIIFKTKGRYTEEMEGIFAGH
ncbi:MAG: hypothetical protein KAW12_04365 [Candidatus Aminicenantes bacterium]|nr:hypothetical protein [Candidatus Aminicenantes bacterium]